MIKTKGVYHIGIPVNNMARAVKFYTEILGMTNLRSGQDDMGKVLSREELRSGDFPVVLFQRPKPVERNAVEEDGATHQAFFVDNDEFDTAMEKMKAAGVKIHETATVDRGALGRGMYFFDTEGNLLQLYAPPK
jgi:catechol 2,3-dioxygenase-like lactoylglutathione lyase family enzyme